MSETTGSSSSPRVSTVPASSAQTMNASSGSALCPTRIGTADHVTLHAVRKGRLSESIQDYLKSIYKLQAETGRVTIGALAHDKAVSPASASAMVKKLDRARAARARALPRRVSDAGRRARRARGDPPPPAARALPGRDARPARRRRPRRGRPARARHLRGARSANRPGARLPDARSARDPIPDANLNGRLRQQPVRVSGPVEGVCGNREVSQLSSLRRLSGRRSSAPSGSSSSSRRNGRAVSSPPSSSDDDDLVLERRVRSLEAVLELEALPDVVVRSRAASVSRCSGSTIRPTAHTAPGRRSIQIRTRSRVAVVVPPFDDPLCEAPRPGLGFHASTIQSTRGPEGHLRRRVLVSAVALAGRGAARPVRDPRAQARPAARARFSRTPTSKNRCTPEQVERLLDRPELIHSIGDDMIAEARAVRGLPRGSVAEPGARASSTTRAAAARSQAASPFDLKTTMSSSLARPCTSPATTACNSCTSSQSRTPRATGSIRSPASTCAWARRSQQTNDARSRTTLSSSRHVGSFAPMPHTSAPGCSHSPRSTGSRAVVAVTTMSQAPASLCDSPASQSCSRQNRASRSGSRP